MVKKKATGQDVKTSIKKPTSKPVERKQRSGRDGGLRSHVRNLGKPSRARAKREDDDDDDDAKDTLSTLLTKPTQRKTEVAVTQTTKEKGKEAEEKAEKRGAVLRKKPSQQVLDRVSRVQGQTMYLVDRQRTPMATAASSSSLPACTASEQFKVLGSTGNVYTVTIDERPACDCPDAQRNSHLVCKHVLFVFLRVLGVEESSHVWYQKALLPSELVQIFANARPDPTVSNPSLLRAYQRASSSSSLTPSSAAASESGGKRRIPQPGDTCPVCYEEFDVGQTDNLVFCRDSCGNPLHMNCAQEWAQACPKRGQPVTCIYCRAVLEEIQVKSERSAEQEPYLNLSHHSTLVNRQRDYSIYSRQSQYWIQRRLP